MSDNESLQTQLSILKKRKKELEKEITKIGQKDRELEGEAEALRKAVEGSDPEQQREKELERKKKIKVLEEKEVKEQKRLEKLREDLVAKDEAQQEEERKQKELNNEEKKEKTILSGLEKEKNNLELLGDKKLASIDKRAPAMAEEIDKAMKSKSKFKVRPIGPVGNLLELSEEADGNPELVKLLEAELGTNLLKSYLCNDDQDRKLLWEIINKVYGSQSQWRPTVFTTKFLKHRHNVARVEGHRTLMDFLKLTGPEEDQVVVFNHLVDLKRIESVVVKSSQTEAGGLCTLRQNVPANLESCITWDLYRYFPATPTSSYRSYYIVPASSNILGSRLSSKINQQNQLIEESKEKIRNVRLEAEKRKKDVKDLESNKKQLKSEISRLSKSLTEITKSKSRLKAQDPSEELKIQEKSLQLKLEDLRKLKEEKSTKLKQLEALEKEESCKTDEVQNNFAKAKKSRQEIAPIQAEMDKVQGDLSVKRRIKLNHERLRTSHVKDRDDFRKRLESEENTEKRAREKSKELGGGEELQPGGTLLEIQAKIKLLAKKITPGGVNEASLLEECLRVKEVFEDQKRELENLEVFVVQLAEMNRNRTENYMKVRRLITKIVRRQFFYAANQMTQVDHNDLTSGTSFNIFYFSSTRRSTSTSTTRRRRSAFSSPTTMKKKSTRTCPVCQEERSLSSR